MVVGSSEQHTFKISKNKTILTFIEFRICSFYLSFFSRRANFVNLFVKGQNSDIYQTACKNVENSYHQCHHSVGMSCSLKSPFEYKNKGKMNTENEKKIKLLLGPICDLRKRNHKFTNSPIHKFRVLQKGQKSF